MQLTEHFADRELGVAGEIDPRIYANAVFLCKEVLEPIHAKFGAVRIHDGYRDPGHNAADVDAQGTTIQILFDWLRLESDLPFDKVILEKNAAEVPACVHIQIDRLNKPRRQAFIGHTGNSLRYDQVEVR